MAGEAETAPGCPFCAAPERRVLCYEDDRVFALVDAAPINAYHMLVIPRAHVTGFAELPAELAAHLVLVAQGLSRALRSVARPDAITHTTDDDLAGSWNRVAHFKLHLIPRWRDDRVRLDWNRPPAPDLAERANQADALRKALAEARG